MSRVYPVIALLLGLLTATAAAQDAGSATTDSSLPTIASKTSDFDKRDGLLPVYYDAEEGAVFLEISTSQEPLLYRPILAGGLGSNDIGLDRGRFGRGRIVEFKPVGRRVLLFEENLGFRATSDNEDERKAVDDAFATTVLFSFNVVAREGDRLLIDATDFVVRDAQGLSRQFRNTSQGKFTIDSRRSALNPDVLLSFPENVELEAWLTFSSDDPGRFVRDVAPDPHAVTLRVRHSFIKLPDDDFEPREFDPRAGYFGIEFVDYATPVSAQKERRFIARHRLQASNGRAVEPIVYYLDRGAPEPIRSALLDGARWWADAFEAAGIEDAYRVELLPEGADPMDIRYNIIQWVHRSTRGWSWGGTVLDPRTGEIMKGHVALGSLRVRQDYLLALGVLGDVFANAESDSDPRLEMALARIRQLSAHEVGHTLGLTHNFAASVNDRASVMDYPAPFVMLDQAGDVDLSDAYAIGIGEWDRVAIRYGYTQFEAGADERQELNRILDDARSAGLRYISDSDARPAGGAHPLAHLWDNGTDPVAALELDMRVRERGLSKLSVDVVAEGLPVATIEEVLVPLYLRHRYQLEAVAKLVAGVSYEYAVAGSDFEGPSAVDPDEQRRALAAMLSALDPEQLEIPMSIRSLIPPRPPGYPQSRELFDGQTGLVFDPFTPAVTISDFVFGLVLEPARAARLHNQHLESPAQPSFESVLSDVTEFVVQRDESETEHRKELRRLVEASWVRSLLHAVERYRNPSASAIVLAQLQRITEDYSVADDELDSMEAAHRTYLVHQITKRLERPLTDKDLVAPTPMPPGSPIGTSPSPQ